MKFSNIAFSTQPTGNSGLFNNAAIPHDLEPKEGRSLKLHQREGEEVRREI
jgi:hypothetical protein